jgi:hypothetical protein
MSLTKKIGITIAMLLVSILVGVGVAMLGTLAVHLVTVWTVITLMRLASLF